MCPEALTTSSAPSPPLPPLRTVLEGYRALAPHGPVYIGQILILTLVIWLLQVTTKFAVGLPAHATPAVMSRILYIVLYIACGIIPLIAGGTAMLISCQRALILGRRPTLRDAFRLRRSEFGVLRSVCVYWLIVHLVPTIAAQVHPPTLQEVLGW